MECNRKGEAMRYIDRRYFTVDLGMFHFKVLVYNLPDVYTAEETG